MIVKRCCVVLGCIFTLLCLLSGAASARVVTEFSVGTTPQGITAGPDGNLWFTEFNVDKIGRITPTGTLTEFRTGITPGAHPAVITLGPDGNLWFTENGTSSIGSRPRAAARRTIRPGP